MTVLQANPHRPLTPAETQRRTALAAYLDTCSEDELIEDVLLSVLTGQQPATGRTGHQLTTSGSGRHTTWRCHCSEVTYRPALAEHCRLLNGRASTRRAQ